jgi:nucleotide-binding universal stress UspA family protein
MTKILDPHAILVPLDGSTLAEQAMPLAIALARSGQCRLRLVHVQVLPLWPDELANPVALSTTRRILHAEGETYLRDVCQRYHAPALEMDTVVLPGELLDVGQAILNHINEHPVSKVVMATHGRGGVRRAWLGSVADFLIRHLTVPVMVVRPGMELSATGRHILVPLDGSALGETVLPLATEIATANQQELVLLRVVPPVMQALAGLEAPYVGMDAELTAFHRSAAEDYLEDLEDGMRERGIKCSTMVMVDQSPAGTIIDLARPANFAMIVMATHGRGGLRRVVLGGIADKVVRGAEVPVMVFRPNGVASREAVNQTRARLAGPTSCST